MSIRKIIFDITESLVSIANKIKTAFDIRDFFVYAGLAMLFYGLYIYSPSLAFSVIGALLIIMGYIMKGK